MQAEEIPSAVSYQTLLEALGKKNMLAYSPEERVEIAHLIQCLKHLQSETEYRVLLARQIEAKKGEDEFLQLKKFWRKIEERCSQLLHNALLKLFPSHGN